MKVYYVDRKTQIRHFTDLSVIKDLTPVKNLSLSVPARENFVIQLLVLPGSEREISRVDVSPEFDSVCINTQKTDKFGKSHNCPVHLEKNAIQPFFVILKANPLNERKCKTGKISFFYDNKNYEIKLTVNYTGEPVRNGGFDDLERLSRLLWLNSSRFIDNEITEPYIIPEISQNSVSILGRKIFFGKNGLPSKIFSYFDEGINLKSSVQKSILSAPMEFIIQNENVDYLQISFKQDKGKVDISCSGESENLSVKTKGTLHYEGSIYYSVKISAKKDCLLKNAGLCTYITKECAEYMNGLGKVGGRAAKVDFKWSAEQHLDSLYIGAVNAGIRLKWKAENYVRPLINIYYFNQPLVVPKTTWDNCSKGGIFCKPNETGADILAQTFDFHLKKSEEKSFNFEIHILPFKPIDYKKHYSVRYYHNYNLKNEFKAADEAAKRSLTHMVIHHGNYVHPFINYPFIETDKLKHLVQYAEYKRLGVKVYYTVREHSNHMAEVFAYKALGGEIIMRRQGKGYSWQGGTAKWLTDYFGDKIIPAWKVEYSNGKYKNDPDVSFIVCPDSRLDNYYIEGLDWLVKNIGIKGIYIDDTAMDRTTVERAKKVLSQNGGLIDMHMWNHEEERAGNVSCMNLYTELFPFLDSLWIGEGYDYKNLSPEYLLTEVSGIPYGQTSQMLEGGGNPYIGMLFAMNNRYGWGVKNARNIYSLWDSFGIESSEMRGWWHSCNPVDTGNQSVKATVYIKSGSALVCLFNFSDSYENAALRFDKGLLGFSPYKANKVFIKGLQRKKNIDLSLPLRLKRKSGIILQVSQ